MDLETGGIVTYTNPSDKERFYKSPPYFLVAFESQIKLNRVIEIIESLVGQFESEKKRTLDGIFILDQGWAIDFGDGKGAFQYGTGENDSISGWACSDSSNTLWDLLGWLSITMPRVKRYMPILAPYFVSKRLINNED